MSTTTSIADKVDRRRRILIASLHPDYFWSKALADGTFTLKIGSGVGTNRITSISYSLDDGRTWVTTQNVNSTAVTITTPTVLTGNKVLWKGEAVGMAYNFSNNNFSTFTGSANYEIGGNLSSLLYGDNMLGQQYNALTTDCSFYQFFYNSSKLLSAEKLLIPFKTTTSYRVYQQMFYLSKNMTKPPTILLESMEGYCMASMFNGCTALTTAPELHLTKVGRQGCQNMFKDCTSLTTPPPELKATKLENQNAYDAMFRGCSALTTAPIIRATTLGASNLMIQMFYGCSSLVQAPVLLPLTLKSACYKQMFYGCTSLNYIKMMATDISASDALTDWVNGVNSVGTFVKNANAQWTLPTGASGIPTNFTVTSE